MDLSRALESQLAATLAMFRAAIDLCPEDLWLGGEHPRNPWRIAYHALYYTDMYTLPTGDDFVRYSGHREQTNELWRTPPVVPAYSRAEMLAYCDRLSAELSDRMANLDVNADQSGIEWYDMPKAELLMVATRHLQGHFGQLSELLFARGIETPWVGGYKRDEKVLD